MAEQGQPNYIGRVETSRTHRKLIACRGHSAQAAHLHRDGRRCVADLLAQAVHQRADLHATQWSIGDMRCALVL